MTFEIQERQIVENRIIVRREEHLLNAKISVGAILSELIFNYI